MSESHLNANNKSVVITRILLLPPPPHVISHLMSSWHLMSHLMYMSHLNIIERPAMARRAAADTAIPRDCPKHLSCVGNRDYVWRHGGHLALLGYAFVTLLQILDTRKYLSVAVRLAIAVSKTLKALSPCIMMNFDQF